MIRQALLTPNPYSRPGSTILMDGKKIVQKVEGIVVHWVDNPMKSAQHTRDWFELRAYGKHGYGSAHYNVDKDEIVQCIPDDEIAYHVGAGSFPSELYTQLAQHRFQVYPSARTIGIELCHPTEEGWFEEEVLWRAAWLVAGICTRYQLDPFFQIYRHCDITGKMCPKYWVEHYVNFTNWKRSVVQASKALKSIKEET